MNLLSSMGGTITSAFQYSQVSGGGFFQSSFAGFQTFGDDGFRGSPELCERDHCHRGGLPLFLASQRFGSGAGAGTVPGMCCPPRGGCGFPGFPGGFGGGFPGTGGGFPGAGGGFPMMGGGFPGMNGMGMGQQNPMMAMFMMMMLMMMMQQMMQQQQGQRGGQGGPGGFPGGSPIGMQPGQGQGQGQGQGVELQKGQSYTTPGGATINWQGDEVKIHEPGGGGQCHGTGGQQGGGSFAFAAANGNSAFAMAGSFSGNPCCCCAHQVAKPRDWKVWGDPHVTNPDGSHHEDFSRKNGMFTLQDGTRVVIEADGPKGVTQRVKIFPPGARLGGFDPNQTTSYTDRDRDGKWDNNGNQTVAQAWQGANVSPFGNQLF